MKGSTDKSAIAAHAWTEDHPIRWGDARILQRASRSMEFIVVKEVISTRPAPDNSHFNHDGGYDIPNSWIASLVPRSDFSRVHGRPGNEATGSPHTRRSEVEPARAASMSHPIAP